MAVRPETNVLVELQQKIEGVRFPPDRTRSAYGVPIEGELELKADIDCSQDRKYSSNSVLNHCNGKALSRQAIKKNRV